jgi:hypothetical protein
MRTTKTGSIVLILVGVLTCQPAWSWGDVGHRVVARVAAQKLTPAARTKIAALLGVEDDPASVSDAMADAAIWPDHVARTRFPQSVPWHFIDLSLKNGANDSPDPFVNENTSFGKIIRFSAAIKNGDPDEVAEPGSDLMFLIHFVGDLHQPLHDATDQDRGANCVKVHYPLTNGGTSRQEKLHHAWDTGILEDNLGTDDRALALHFVRDFDQASDDDQKAILLADPRATDVKTAVHVWAMEAHQLALDEVYAPLRPAVPLLAFAEVDSRCTNAAPFTKTLRNLDSDYVTNAARVMDQQLLAGGIRLAALLNAVLQ